MERSLPRRKPIPAPAVHPVPERRADARLRAVYAETKAGLNVPWMGVVTMAFAHFPRFYAALWDGGRGLFASAPFAALCEATHAAATAEAAGFDVADLTPGLLEAGYSLHELREIAAVVDVFDRGNMPYIGLATLARLILEGHTPAGTGRSSPAARAPVAASARPILMEAHHADATTRAVYADIMATLGLPIVNTDYRALARWPSYFAAAWADLKPVVVSQAYEAAVARVHDGVVRGALSLPEASGPSPQRLREAARADGDLDHVIAVVELFQWLLPGLAVNVACLKRQLRGMDVLLRT